jgi:hypothetical protein
VAFASTEKHVLAIASDIEPVVGTKVFQRDVEDVTCCLHRQLFLQLLLRHFQCALTFSFDLDVANLLGVEELVCFFQARFGLFLKNARLFERRLDLSIFTHLSLINYGQHT